MVSRATLLGWLNEYLRVPEVQDFLPNGLQIEGKDEIRRITAAVSINLDVIEKAVSDNSDAILVHHGMFWKNDVSVLTGYRRKRVKLILEHDINLFAYHLPLDVHPEIGHNTLILKGIGAVPQPPEEGGFGRQGSFDPPVSFEKLIERINSTLKTEARYFHHGGNSIAKVYVVSGGGRNEIDRVTGLGVDAYITGDAKESTPYVSRESGMNYIFAGHYSTERLGIMELSKIIAERFGIETRFVDVENTL